MSNRPLGKALIAAAALFVVLCVPALAKKPRNPHWGRPKRSPATAPAGSTGATEHAGAASPRRRLPAGRWRPEVRAAIEELVAAHGKTARSYDDEHPPAAALPFNDLVLVNDVSLAVFQRMVDRADFKFGQAFWQEVPIAYGRQPLRAAYNIFIEEPSSTWLSQPSYHQYRQGFFRAYRDMCSKLGRLECRGWLSKLLIGFNEPELAAYSQTAITEEFQAALGSETVSASLGDRDPVVVRHGLSWVPEMRGLIDLLRDSGFDVWLLDADEQHAFEAAAAQAGFDPSRVQGIRAKIVSGKISSVILPPVPLRGGKANILASQLGRAPLLVIGAGPEDKELLDFAAPGALRLLINGENPELLRIAAEKGWLVQPPFAATAAAQSRGRP